MDSALYIRTFTGKQLFWDDLENHDYDIRDIAHALANNCRWTGHVREFYSVAQHSVLASLFAPKGFELETLLHDGAEAYVHDTPTPLKQYLRDKGFVAFDELEKRIEKAIFAKFNLPWPMSPEVKDVDRRMLVTERRDLMPENCTNDGIIEPYIRLIVPWPPYVAEREYLNRFHRLTGEKE